MDKNRVYEDKYFKVIRPEFPLNCKDDGGHLILIKKEPVTDRSDLTCQEAIDFMRISMAVGKAMYEVLGVERMNYEDLGNWGIDDPGGAKMHLHFMGRAREQTHQIGFHGLRPRPLRGASVVFHRVPLVQGRQKLENSTKRPPTYLTQQI